MNHIGESYFSVQSDRSAWWLAWKATDMCFSACWAGAQSDPWCSICPIILCSPFPLFLSSCSKHISRRMPLCLQYSSWATAQLSCSHTVHSLGACQFTFVCFARPLVQYEDLWHQSVPPLPAWGCAFLILLRLSSHSSCHCHCFRFNFLVLPALFGILLPFGLKVFSLPPFLGCFLLASNFGIFLSVGRTCGSTAFGLRCS